MCAAVAALLGPAAAAHAAKAPAVTVMTRNLFLGADLAPAINAPDIPTAIDGAGTVWNELQATKFAERVVPLAREIKASKADLVGLQEVALWRKQTPSDGGAKPISPLAGRDAGDRGRHGLPRAAARAARLELQGRRRPGGVRRRAARRLGQERCDRHRAAGGLRRRLRRPADDARRDPPAQGQQGEARQDPRRPLQDPLRAERRRASRSRSTAAGPRSRRSVGKSKFRFVNTHLEAFGDPKIREAQAKELTKGPLKTPGR